MLADRAHVLCREVSKRYVVLIAAPKQEIMKPLAAEGASKGAAKQPVLGKHANTLVSRTTNRTHGRHPSGTRRASDAAGEVAESAPAKRVKGSSQVGGAKQRF